MKLEKRENSKRDLPKDSFTAEQAKMVLTGLTKSVANSNSELFVNLNGYGELVIQAIKAGRTSRYSRHDVYAARDCCIIINGTGYNTGEMYLKDNDTLYQVLKTIRPSGEKFIELKGRLGEHLSNMLFELRIVGGGFGISKMDGYDKYKFGPVIDGADDEEAVALSD